MTDPTSDRSKAESSYRLAELAKTPRARELFRELAVEYERRANSDLLTELMRQEEAVPSLVPVAPLVSDAPLAPAVADVAPATEMPLVPQATNPTTPLDESDRFLADLKALRE